ncbi:MAG: bifunctional UDP-sugar hydrolase/5'-nucleotidase [Clostridia bacterium]|jgi:2',3'-cyclic-nucleotide 2'-phosphodiesterase (5'-nucleotidase family)
MVLVLGLPLSCTSEPFKVQVIHANSLRGQVQAVESAGIMRGGFSLVSGAIKETSATAGKIPVFTIAGYNAYHGSPEAYFTHGRAVVDLMNATGFSALIVGPREYYFGQAAIEDLANLAEFPFIAANIMNQDGTRPTYLSQFFYDEEARFGIIGLAPRSIFSQNLAKDVQGLVLLDEVAATLAAVAELKKKGAHLIGLSAGGISWGGTPEAPDTLLAEALLAIDGIDQYWFGSVSPDQPDGMETLYRNGKPKILTVQSGSRHTNGFQLALTTVSDDPESSSYQDILVDSTNMEPDPALVDSLYSIITATGDVMNRRVATAARDLELDFEAECSMGNLLCDILKEYSGAELFLLNSGKIRSAFSAGTITRKHIYDTLPFGGNIVTVQLTGRQILELLERSCSFVGNSKAGRGFLQVSGISFMWRPSAPPFQRVVREAVFINDLPLEENRRYLVGTEAYIFGGGDGYQEFRAEGIEAELPYDESILVLFENALARMGTVDARVEGRIQTIER